MAHFAQLNENNEVIQVIVVANEELMDNGVESEEKGIAFCKSLFNGTWKQTSYNGNFRKRFAGIGQIYNEELDAFMPKKPFPSWTLNTETCNWDAPIPRPDDSYGWVWNEDNMAWEKQENFLTAGLATAPLTSGSETVTV